MTTAVNLYCEEGVLFNEFGYFHHSSAIQLGQIFICRWLFIRIQIIAIDYVFVVSYKYLTYVSVLFSVVSTVKGDSIINATLLTNNVLNV